MGLINITIDTKDIAGMQSELKKVINYLEKIKHDVISEDREGCGLAFDEKPIGDRANGKRGKLCIKG